MFLTVELNTFFLKFCLWIPPRNPVIIYRLILWWLIAIPTIREYNSYLQDRYIFLLFFKKLHLTCILLLGTIIFLLVSYFILCNHCEFSRKPVKKVGAFCWLSLAICIVELLICFKFGYGKCKCKICHLCIIHSYRLFTEINFVPVFSSGLYPKPMPSWLVMFWSSVGLVLVTCLLVWSWHLHRTLGQKKRQ